MAKYDYVPDVGNVNNQDVMSYNATMAKYPELPDGTTFDPVEQQAQAGETLNADQYQVNADGLQVPTTEAATNQAATPEQTAANTYEAAQTEAAQMEGAQGQVSEQAQVDPAQGQLSEETLAGLNEYANQDVSFDPRATVQYQYEQLMDFEAGEIPEWARGAMKTAQQQMAARGMGASSMAAGASTAAIMQAAMPIAQQDAQVFNGLMLKKMDQKAQATFLKAGYLAEMDMANLNNRQQAAVMNAQAFLQMDMANLGNLQQAAVVNSQMRQQALLSNQAAQNAAEQFNATSQNQTDQFFASLASQINMFNAEQANAMEQYNAGQSNSMNRFWAELESARDQFNVQNRMVIDQANAEYLRMINTQNTAMQNQANYVNAMNLLNMSNTAMANEILFARDLAHFTFQSSENAQNRAQNLALQTMSHDLALDRYDAVMARQTASDLGGWVTNLVGDVVNAFVD